MNKNSKQLQDILREFTIIPGVGKIIAQDLYNIGLRSIEDLKDADPEDLYEKICHFQGCLVDRCMLYVCRCAVYYASESHHDAYWLKWWNWKDSNLKNRQLG
jgi:hypothetical protein